MDKNTEFILEISLVYLWPWINRFKWSGKFIKSLGLSKKAWKANYSSLESFDKSGWFILNIYDNYYYFLVIVLFYLLLSNFLYI